MAFIPPAHLQPPPAIVLATARMTADPLRFAANHPVAAYLLADDCLPETPFWREALRRYERNPYRFAANHPPWMTYLLARDLTTPGCPPPCSPPPYPCPPIPPVPTPASMSLLGFGVSLSLILAALRRRYFTENASL